MKKQVNELIEIQQNLHNNLLNRILYLNNIDAGNIEFTDEYELYELMKSTQNVVKRNTEGTIKNLKNLLSMLNIDIYNL